MKKVSEILRVMAMICLIVLNLVFTLTSFEEYYNYGAIFLIILLTIITIIISKYFNKKLKKYELTPKIYHYLGIFGINLLMLIYAILIQEVTILNIITLIIINFAYWIVIVNTNKKTIYKKIFLKKGIKYCISSIILVLFLILVLIDSYALEDILVKSMLILGLVHISFSFSPLFDYICKKTNKSFNGVRKTLFALVPLTVLTLIDVMFIFVGTEFFDFGEPSVLVTILLLILYLIICICFFIFNNHKYNEANKSKFWKVILTIILYFISSTLLIGFITKCYLVYNVNQKLTTNNVEKETIIIESKELNFSESYLELEWLSIKNNFTNAYISNTYYNNGTKVLKLGDKSAIFSKPYNFAQIDYSNSVYSLLFDGADNLYEINNYIYNNSKSKVSIFDNMGIILASDMQNEYNYENYTFNKIEFNNYVGFLREYNKYYSMVLYNLEKETGYTISFDNYSKEEIIDLISTIIINEEYIEANTDEPNIYFEEESLKNYSNDYLNEFYKNIDSLEIKCYDDYCNTGSLILANNNYDLNNFEILYHTNFMLLINHYESYNMLQIFDKKGVEVVNATYQEIVKIGDVYKPYSLRYKDGIFHYYENINGEYIHKTIDTNNKYLIENYNN